MVFMSDRRMRHTIKPRLSGLAWVDVQTVTTGEEKYNDRQAYAKKIIDEYERGKIK